MEQLQPLPSHSSKRSPDRISSRPPKRPRPTSPSPNVPPPPLNFLYAPNRHIDVDKLLANDSSREVIVHIYADHLTSANHAIKNRLLWGTHMYTEDSDIVAILLHTGHYVPPAAKSATFDFLSVRVRVDRHVRRKSPPFEASDRNGLRSRSWSCVYDGGRLSVLGVSVFKNEKSYELHPNVEPRPVPLPRIVSRSSSSGEHAKVQALIDTIVSFDMVSHPCLKYDLRQIASVDKDNSTQPQSRLKHEVLYLEDDHDRYEISLLPNDTEAVRFAKVKRTAITREIIQGAASSLDVVVPLCEADLDILVEAPWNEFYWDLKGVSVRGKNYKLSKMSFRRKREIDS